MTIYKAFVATLRKNITFNLFFIFVILSLSLITFYILCKSHGVLQRNIFFYNPNDSFMDFFNVNKYISSRDPYNSTYFPMSEKAYPPLTYLLLYPFSKFFDYINLSPGAARDSQLGIMSLLIFIVFSCSVLAVLLYEFTKGSKSVRFFTVLALFASGVSLFSLERGNIIYLSVICLLFFVMFYKSENKMLRELSYIALAISVALKVYPIIFASLILYEKRYKDIFKIGIYCIISFFLPFLYFKGGFNNIPIMIRNVGENTQAYMFSGYQYRFGLVSDSILFGLSNQTSLLFAKISVVILILAFLTTWSHKKYWKTVLCFTCALLSTPVNSGYYCGLYFFIPVVLFLNEKEHSLSDWYYLILMILVLNPYQITYHQLPLTTSISNLSVLLIYFTLCAESFIYSIRFIKTKMIKKECISGDTWPPCPYLSQIVTKNCMESLYTFDCFLIFKLKKCVYLPLDTGFAIKYLRHNSKE